jgi:hypothetical protein
MDDRRLAYLFRSPTIVESAVRAALADALTVRRMRLAEVDARTFGNRALAFLRDSHELAQPLDELAGHELEVATVHAASRFFASKLARRLFTIESARLAAAPPGADAAVRDSRGRLHIVRIETCASDDQRVRLGKRLATLGDASRALHAPCVHFFSLRDAKLRSFTFAESSARGAA